MKIPEAKAAVDKEWKKLETVPAWNLEKSQEQKGGYSGSTKRQKESPLCFIDGHMSPQECGVGTQITAQYKGRVVLRVDIVNTALEPTQFLLNRARLHPSICLFPRKIGGCSQIAQNSGIGMSRCLDTSSTTQMAQIVGGTIEDPVDTS